MAVLARRTSKAKKNIVHYNGWRSVSPTKLLEITHVLTVSLGDTTKDVDCFCIS